MVVQIKSSGQTNILRSIWQHLSLLVMVSLTGINKNTRFNSSSEFERAPAGDNVSILARILRFMRWLLGFLRCDLYASGII